MSKKDKLSTKPECDAKTSGAAAAKVRRKDEREVQRRATLSAVCWMTMRPEHEPTDHLYWR